jgi:hypothetical protein
MLKIPTFDVGVKRLANRVNSCGKRPRTPRPWLSPRPKDDRHQAIARSSKSLAPTKRRQPPTLPAMLTHLEHTATTLGRSDLAASAAWLANRPGAEDAVGVRHGDLHPFSVLVYDTGGITVLDLSAALLAPCHVRPRVRGAAARRTATGRPRSVAACPEPRRTRPVEPIHGGLRARPV